MINNTDSVGCCKKVTVIFCFYTDSQFLKRILALSSFSLWQARWDLLVIGIGSVCLRDILTRRRWVCLSFLIVTVLFRYLYQFYGSCYHRMHKNILRGLLVWYKDLIICIPWTVCNGLILQQCAGWPLDLHKLTKYGDRTHWSVRTQHRLQTASSCFNGNPVS